MCRPVLPPGMLRNGNGQLTDVALIYMAWGGLSALGSGLLIVSFIVKRQLRTPTLLRVLWMSLADLCFSSKFLFGGLLGIKVRCGVTTAICLLRWFLLMQLTAGSFSCNMSGAVGLFSWNCTIAWFVRLLASTLRLVLTFSCAGTT
jgi:hypothetical protein